MSASLPSVVDRDWSAEDSYTVHVRLRSGGHAVLQASAADWGPILIVSRIAGSTGAAWSEGDTVRIADASGTREVPIPDDLAPLPWQPPPSDMLVTSYDLLHSTGMDVGPYTRLYGVFRDLIDGVSIPEDPPPATFADGVANMVVVDAIRRAAAEQRWVELEA